MEKSILDKVDDAFPPFSSSVKINEWKWFVADTMVTLIYVITALGYIYQHTRPGAAFMLGSLVALLGFVNQFTSVFHDIAFQYTNIVQYNTNVQTARFIAEAYKEHHLPDSNEALPSNWSAIDIKGLNFSHKDIYSAEAKAHSLHDINIRIEKGKRIAFIGESGSGKSTLMAVLRGLYDPQPGTIISIDNKLTTDAAGIASSITLFPQEPEIFENTIEHNITLGLPFDEKDILDVCETAHFTEVIKHLPNGLQSNIQEKGVNYPADKNNGLHWRVVYWLQKAVRSSCWMSLPAVLMQKQKYRSTKNCLQPVKAKQLYQHFIACTC